MNVTNNTFNTVERPGLRLFQRHRSFRPWWRQAVTMLLALSFIVSAPVASAASPAIFTVDSDLVKFWTGSVDRNGPNADVPECQSVSCDHVKVKVKLPTNVWSQPGGLEVSIRWQGGFFDILNLYVYKDGVRVAASEAGVGIAQSVNIPSASNGTYHVYVAYTPFAESDTINYEGLAETEYLPAALPDRDLLPDLEARHQQNVTFDTPLFDLFEPAPAPGETCFDSEKNEFGAQTCLRFDQIMANIGEGALDMRAQREVGTVGVPCLHDDGDEDHLCMPAMQRLYRSTGGFTDVSVGEFEFHGVHGHYHFNGFAQSVLWATDGSGNRTGAAPVAEGNKVSFCIADTGLDKWGVKGNGPTTYPAPNCLEPESVVGDTEFFKQGMTAGFEDRYTWDLPAQYVEVTGLADGIYILDTTVDPDNQLHESSDTNNCASVRVQLTNVNTPARHAEILGPGPACAS